MTENQHKAELLMPAGTVEKLRIAVAYGADAVYLGTPDMSLRTKSGFSLEDAASGVEFAHANGRRAYLTLNLFSHNSDIEKLPGFLDTIRQVHPDGVIVADPGVFAFVKEHAPELELHISTQANLCSWLSVKFWEDQGAKLCVLAREVSFAELAEIREKCRDIKLEAFVHGSMCMTYSGRCMLSNYLAERGANQGNCANSCRWNYRVNMQLKDGTIKELELSEENLELFDFVLSEGVRPGELMPIEEDSRGTYILNSKDLCLMPRLDEMLGIGVDSLKIEGRSKSQYYVGMTARAYRMAIDDYYAAPEEWSPAPYMRELHKIPNRGYTLAFHEGRLTHHAHNYEDTHTLAEWEYAGLITQVRAGSFMMLVKNMLRAGDVLEFVSPTSRATVLLRIYEFRDTVRGKVSDEVHAGWQPIIEIPFEWFDRESDELRARFAELFPPYTIIRKERDITEAEAARIRLDAEAARIELGRGGKEEVYQDKLSTLQDEMTREREHKTYRDPRNLRVGRDGCCGKGCNGCMIFWHDDKYEKARTLLAQKKQGELLAVEEIRNVVGL